MGERPHLVGHHGEGSATAAGLGGDDRSVQCSRLVFWSISDGPE